MLSSPRPIKEPPSHTRAPPPSHKTTPPCLPLHTIDDLTPIVDAPEDEQLVVCRRKAVTRSGRRRRAFDLVAEISCRTRDRWSKELKRTAERYDSQPHAWDSLHHGTVGLGHTTCTLFGMRVSRERNDWAPVGWRRAFTHLSELKSPPSSPFPTPWAQNQSSLSVPLSRPSPLPSHFLTLFLFC